MDMLLALTPPAVVKLPPTYTLEPLTAVAIALTAPLVPVPRADQLLVEVFHLAMLSHPDVQEVFAEVTLPPTYTSEPLMAMAFTMGVGVLVVEMPEPRADHEEPSHMAMRLALFPPAV